MSQRIYYDEANERAFRFYSFNLFQQLRLLQYKIYNIQGITWITMFKIVWTHQGINNFKSFF